MISKSHLILPPSYSFPLLNILTLLFIYAKNTSDLFVRWLIILSPTLIYLIIQILISLKDLFFLETHDIQINILEIQLILTNKFARILLSTISLIFLIFLAEYLDFLDYPPQEPFPQYDLVHLYIIAFLILIGFFIYSIVINRMMRRDVDNNVSSSEKINIFTILMNSIFSILGNTMTICSSGACNSIYISTLSAFFSAFGITIVDWLPYLRYSAIVFILISIFSLYSAKKSLIYAPFLVCLVGSILILSSMFYFENSYLLYIGNILMIGAAIRNAKVNKAGFGKAKLKKENV